ncbi:hypothetical protein EIL87_19745 [Saccharopolyspora rhizosphaerae]|uniref:Uncharacterized protein n=1 Tax=Saccharopolyspora rhizosphaerae TaxID=2492662 RepID=A0A426JMU4_9PSEU|nr:hypothetical protein [Saccharopolyspora rhizosphaerae]RRO14539.1 hypothetical protein EIL87_19745 [Saccharopolyspora rhizosphaerae]
MNAPQEHGKALEAVESRVAGRKHQVKRGVSRGPKAIAKGAWRCEGQWQCANQMDLWECADEVELDERRKRGEDDED